MRRVIWAALLAMLLSACTTIRELRENHAPRATYKSTKSSAALEQCLAERLSWAGTPSIIRGELNTQIAIMDRGSAVIMATIIPGSSGQTVEARQLITYGARVRRNFESCI